MSNSNNSESTEKQSISAEEIEAKLDEIEEEENEDFNNWFNSYVGGEKQTSKTEDNDKTDDKSVEKESNKQQVDEPTNEQNVVEDTNEQNIVEDTNEQQSNDEITTAETTEEQTTEQQVDEITTDQSGGVKDTESTNEEITEQTTEQTTEAPLPSTADSTFTLSDVQGKKHEKTDVVITKHRKHRSRKTELTSSLPPKEPVTLQENEHGKVEIGTKKSKKLSDEELEKEIHKTYDKTVTNIKSQVEEMVQNGNCRQLDAINYTPGSEKFNIFKQYLLHPLLVPKRCVTRMSLNEYINSITIFKYNCFDTPNVSMQHPIPEKVIFAERLNNVFNHKFIDVNSGDFHFKDLDAQLLGYISGYQDKGTLSFEYKLIKSTLGKLILNLNSDVELALRDNTRPTLNSAFKQVIVRDIQQMKFIQDPNGKTFISWKAFLDTLLSLGSDKLIFVFDTYRNLNIKLDKAYNTDFLIENLLGNTLKCYLPSVALNYFYTIKSIYIIARLSSLYIQLQLFKNKSHEQVMNDLYTIAVAGVMIYENKSFIYKSASRTLPTYDKPLSNETKLYILNHLLTGGQYYILKMLEESLPVIAADLVDIKQ